MDSELIKLKESVLLLTSKLSKDDIRIKLLYIEYLLTEYDTFDNSEENIRLTPAQILNNSLESFNLENISKRVYFEWFAVLALYWLNKIDEIPLYKEQSLENCRHAHNLAQAYMDKANRVDKEYNGQKAIVNRQIATELNKKKYIRNKRLKKLAFGKYPKIYKELQQEGKRVTYDAISLRILPIIDKYNIHPITRKKVIGRDKVGGTFGDPIGTLNKWFKIGVKNGQLKSPRHN